eukprot:TRINITY_DN22530_c0_g1_i1.p1 TRINITY_DN22530_c0_g1~~TRINITY_DN22530_c0_g1_i1.p1  ORF type:complete len:726 (-),score=131.11 TRINITY_DN22530_c0_g1_i1:87-2264(-)
MASTNRTSWTNMTVDLLRNNPHVDCKPILKRLVQKTIESGIRFVSQQSKVTEGVRNVRLDAWYYIRQVSEDDVLRALLDSGASSEALRREIQESMGKQQFYHVVIRGNDPNFMPLGVVDGQDVVTNYCCERIDLIHEEVDKYLFDELSDPQALQQAMSDPLFDQMLEYYFRSGDTKHEETLHVVSRFRGGANLLHSCIKEGHLESLRLLLSKYTLENHGHDARWRVLAEPLRPVGQYKITAFHRAVYDGQPQCLQELVLWAQHHSHDITQLRNVEERTMLGDTVKGLSCLELAEQENNLACYNILAPLFSAPTKRNGIDANPREARLALRMIPRVEVATEEGEALRTVELTNFDWCNVLDAVRLLWNGHDEDPGHVLIRIESVAFNSDASEEQLDQLLAKTEGMLAIEANGCMMKSDKTALHCLRVVVGRLNQSEADHLPSGMPQKVHLSSPVANELALEEQANVDAETAKLQSELTRLCGNWPGFLGARNGLISVKQRQRLALSDDCTIHAASFASIYATRLFCFVRHHGFADDDTGLGAWIRQRELMPLARAVFKNFFSHEKLLASEFSNCGRALDPAVVHFLKITLSAWFSTVPQDARENTWSVWGDRLRADHEVMDELASALDKVLDSLLRMWKALDAACQHPKAKSAGAVSIGHLIKACVPEPLMDRLWRTEGRLKKYYPSFFSQQMKPQRVRVSLLSTSTSLRPGTGQPLRAKQQQRHE